MAAAPLRRYAAWLPQKGVLSVVARYGLAVVLTAFALLLRFSLQGVFPPQGFPFLTFFPAVLLSVYLAGLGPGLTATGLSVAAAWYFFMSPPFGQFGGLSEPDKVALLFFTAVLLIDTFVIDVMNNALQRLRQAEARLQEADHHLRTSRADALAAAELANRDRGLLDAVFNAVPAGIIVADSDGRLLRMNRANARIWGLAPYSTSIEGYGDWKGWWAGDSPRAGQRIASQDWGLARSLRTGQECNDIVEIEPFDRPGTRLVTLLSSAPVLDPAGVVVGGVVVQFDITDRIQAERALREADKQKDTFLATLSHELRNPLAPIRSAAHVIRLTPGVDARAERAAAVIERQSAQLARLVDDLLDVSRLNFGNLQLQRQRLDLRQVVETALETSRPLLDAGGHRLAVRTADRPLPVYADETRIAQCVANLVNNACKFTPAGGAVEVDVRAIDERWASVTVTDNGQGIAPDMLEKVFELFAQEQRSGMGGNTGLGIGLALVRRLVQMHGGQVQARSEGVGRGASFEIRLPLGRREVDVPVEPASSPGVPSGAAGGRSEEDRTSDRGT